MTPLGLSGRKFSDVSLDPKHEKLQNAVASPKLCDAGRSPRFQDLIEDPVGPIT